MPPGSSNDKPQPKSSGFASSNNLYPTKSIWNTTTSFPNTHARGPSLGSKDPADNASAANAFHANSESQNVWGTSPWNNEVPSRPSSTSPNRTRDNGIPKTAGFGAGTDAHAPVNLINGFNGVNGGSLYGGPSFSMQKRSPHESSFFDSVGAFPPSRDGSAPPTLPEQGSPQFQEFLNGGRISGAHGHAHSNSIPSQRQGPGGSISLPHQMVNNRAYNKNKQVEEDMSIGYNRRVPVDHSASGTPTFDPSSQPFQSNHGSQAFGDANAARFSTGSDPQLDPMINQFAALKRPSVGRVSPAPSYRLEVSNSPRGYAQSPDLWNTRPSSRDPRTTDADRRTPSQQVPQAFPGPFFPGQFAYPQFPPSYLDPYGQNLRHPMVSGYAVPPLSPGYPISGTLPNIRPVVNHDPVRGMRSAVLEEFRSNSKTSKKYELKDLYNYVVEFSGDQHGSRFIQQKLETANSDEKDQVFREIEPNAIQLMKDVFGNYVVQKFFEHGNQVQKRILAEKMRGKMVDLSVQVYACRVVQKALEHVLVEQQAELTRELAADVYKVITDQNGNHVIQKVIELVPRQYLDFIMNALRGQVTTLSTHQYGCRVVQRMMEYGTEADKAAIVRELHPSAHILLTDQFGNYVAQHVIRKGKPEDREKMIRLVMGQLIELCKHKFASNVVETCIEAGSPALVTEIRERFVTPGEDGTSPLPQLMRDNYGNYVIQKLFATLKGPELDSFADEIKPLFYLQKKNGNSRQLTALEKLLDEYALNAVKGDRPAHSDDASSTVPTPASTNEANSVNSDSPLTSVGTADGSAPVTVDQKQDDNVNASSAAQDTQNES
ncbi:unnamed protein product [Clonostachys byssicola]|uniref:PUM-HD domain-containing protein n=1 Tax=Clonostachys byssicola TaxID=160290 RepID=A0A9N9U3U5_9HYPO|nr:unnamed protein product [Clonostachys byssicola]